MTVVSLVDYRVEKRMVALNAAHDEVIDYLVHEEKVNKSLFVHLSRVIYQLIRTLPLNERITIIPAHGAGTGELKLQDTSLPPAREWGTPVDYYPVAIFYSRGGESVPHRASDIARYKAIVNGTHTTPSVKCLIKALQGLSPNIVVRVDKQLDVTILGIASPDHKDQVTILLCLELDKWIGEQLRTQK